MKKYPYRMSYMYISFFLIATGYMFYGVWAGRADQGFASTITAKFLVLIMFGIPLVIFLRPPSLRYIVIDNDKIVIPRLFNPFLDKTIVRFTDIIEVYDQIRTPWLGLRAITIVTKNGRYNIYPGFLRRLRGLSKDYVEAKIFITLKDIENAK